MGRDEGTARRKWKVEGKKEGIKYRGKARREVGDEGWEKGKA